MKQIYGPYRLTAGDHEEDVPSGVSFKVKELQPSYVVAEDGQRLPIDRGTYLLHGGSSHSIWRAEKRVALTELSVGDEVELCHGVRYGAPDVPQRLRKAGINYADSFMSNRELDVLYNRPNAIKFLKATDVSQADEIEQLRRANAELREHLAQAQQAKLSAADAGKSAQDAGKIAQENADKRQQPDNRNQPQQHQQGRKQLQPA